MNKRSLSSSLQRLSAKGLIRVNDVRSKEYGENKTASLLNEDTFNKKSAKDN